MTDQDDKPKNDKPKRDGKPRRFTYQFGWGQPPVPPRPPTPPMPPRPPMMPDMPMGAAFPFNNPVSEADQQQLEGITRLQNALNSLIQTVEHTLQTDLWNGTQTMVQQSYTRLYERAIKLLPQDDTLTDSIPQTFDCDDERTCLMQTMLAARQLAHYLESVLRDLRRPSGTWGDIRNLGRQLSDQILSATKGVIGRAMADIDIDFGSSDGENFMGADLRNQNLTDRDYQDANFVGANLSGVNASGTNFEDCNFAGATLNDANFSSANCPDANFSGINASKVNFADANLEDATFAGSNLREATFTDSNLSDANFKGANLQYVNFSDANLEDASFSSSNMEHANFENANLESASFTNSNLTDVNFAGVNAEDAVFKHSNLSGANFREANLEDANFTGANLSGADFTNASLEDTVMPDGRVYRRGDNLARFGINVRYSEGKDKKKKGAPVETGDSPESLETWVGANLRGQDLRQYDLTDGALNATIFTQANLQGVLIVNADCSSALFIGANLREANLTSANLTNANLAGAYLMNANLTNANLTGANIGGATLTGANLTGATLPDGTRYTPDSDLMQYGAIAD